MFMKNKKVLIVFSLLFILILSLGAISASEDLDNKVGDMDSSVDENFGVVADVDNEINDNEEITVTNVEENDDALSEDEPSIITLNGGTFGDIENAINESKNGDTIQLNGTFENTGNTIYLSNQVNIVGLGEAVLDGKNLSVDIRLYAPVLIKGLKFINSNNGYFFAQEGFCVENCNFDDVNMSFNMGKNSSIVNCSFNGGISQNYSATFYSHNSALFSIADCNFSSKYVVSIDGANEIVNSNFSNNNALYVSHANEIVNCSFWKNTCNSYVALMCGAEMFKGCNFERNHISGYESYLCGGKVFDTCSFVNNTGNNSTYGLICEACEILNSNFESNHLDAEMLIHCADNVSIIESTFADHNFDSRGFPIRLFDKTHEILNSSFVKCRLSCSNDTSVRNCNFGEDVSIEFNRGNVENCSFINIASADAYDSNCLFNNCSFINNSYGAIYANCRFANSLFENNTRDGSANVFGVSSGEAGGAIAGKPTAVNCIFKNNHALLYGGAIWGSHTVINCTFINNSAKYGGALSGSLKVENSTFINNSANVGAAIVIGTKNVTFKNCTFDKNVGTDVKGDIVRMGSVFSLYPNIKTTYNSSAKFSIKFIYNYDPNDYNDDGTPLNSGQISFSVGNIKRTVNIVNGAATFSLNGLNPGTYDVVWTRSDSVEYFDYPTYFEGSSGYLSIKINKGTPKFVVSSITTVYNGGKYLVATLKDSRNNILKNAKVTIKFNGKTYSRSTDSKGQVKLTTNGLAPKTYTAAFAYANNAYYNKASKSVKVVVKKATPKLTAKAKTFKVGVKVKKYSVTLKDNKNKVMKNTKITLKVNGKSFAVKTNSKGVATFKITNLKKKGSFKATITYAGNKLYNKVSKTAKIIVK